MTPSIKVGGGLHARTEGLGAPPPGGASGLATPSGNAGGVGGFGPGLAAAAAGASATAAANARAAAAAVAPAARGRLESVSHL